MSEPRNKEDSHNSRSGVTPGETQNTDATRRPDRPVDEEDVFGGAERTHKNEDVESENAKP
jgi:hypothetical protein